MPNCATCENNRKFGICKEDGRSCQNYEPKNNGKFCKRCDCFVEKDIILGYCKLKKKDIAYYESCDEWRRRYPFVSWFE